MHERHWTAAIRQFNNYCFDIMHRRTKESPVPEHFNGDGHTLADMTVVELNQIHNHDPCLHKIWGSRWIRTLGTSYPLEVNLRVDSL